MEGYIVCMLDDDSLITRTWDADFAYISCDLKYVTRSSKS
jgi:hypothetical protein